jgi:hypothetical protein
MWGWQQFAEDIDRLRMATGACRVATSHYAITGQLVYHLRLRARVVQVSEPIRYAHLPPVGSDKLQCRALHVELARRALPAEVASRFGSVLPIGTMTRRHQGQPIATYKIALLSDPLVLLLPAAGRLHHEERRPFADAACVSFSWAVPPSTRACRRVIGQHLSEELVGLGSTIGYPAPATPPPRRSPL